MFGAHTSFNRNIVECKVGGALFGGISNSIVLIETLWNVKRTTLYFPASDRLVLIETLWNVKINRNIYCRISVISFNRNIVECKEESAEKAAESKEAF